MLWWKVEGPFRTGRQLTVCNPTSSVLCDDRSFLTATTWQNAAFDVNQAKIIAAKGGEDIIHFYPQSRLTVPPIGLPDSAPASQLQKHESKTGPIIGGVLGGIVIVALGCVAAWFIMKKRQAKTGVARDIAPRTIPHMRSLSELSQRTTMSGYGAQVAMPLSPGTIHTHSGSYHSLLNISSQASMFSQSTGMRAAQRVPPPPVPVAREAMIDPFPIASPTSPTVRPPNHRKGASDSSEASSVPVNRQEETSTRRFNPPAYPGPSNGSNEHRPGHGNNPGSLDSQTSWDSSFRNAHSPRGGSLSTMDEVSSVSNHEGNHRIA